jgi:hypothetical protein
MNCAKATVIAVGILLIASVGPALATNSDRVRGGDQGSISDLCNQFRQEYRQLHDKQKHGTMTRDERNRMNDLNGQINSMCN